MQGSGPAGSAGRRFSPGGQTGSSIIFHGANEGQTSNCSQLQDFSDKHWERVNIIHVRD